MAQPILNECDLRAPSNLQGRSAGPRADTAREMRVIGATSPKRHLGERYTRRREQRERQTQLRLDARGARRKPEVPAIHSARMLPRDPDARCGYRDALGKTLAEAEERARRRERR